MKTRGLNFMEAVKSCKNFKVSDGTDNDAIVYYYVGDAGIYKHYKDGLDQEISTSEVLYLSNKELEIIEEKKTLSDKFHTIECSQSGFTFDGKKEVGMRNFINWVDSDDVKEANRRFLERLDSEAGDGCEIEKIAKEIYGKELI